MDIQILKPEITNVNNTTWELIRSEWGNKDKRRRWLITLGVFLIPGILIFLSGDVIGGIFAFFFIPIFFGMLFWGSFRNRASASFWQQIATVNGWKYKSNGRCSEEKGIMFKQGDKTMDGNEVSIINHVEGNIDNQDFRIFNFGLVTGGSRRTKDVYDYTVFAFKFNGIFPHLYLNNKHNAFGISVGNYLSLPIEFEKEFLLSAPNEYELEAFEIFTPNILAYLLDNNFTYDIEFVEQEMLVFTEGPVYNFEEFESRFKQILGLKDLFEKKLDSFKFKQIGDQSALLKLDKSESALNKKAHIIFLTTLIAASICMLLFVMWVKWNNLQ